MPRIRYQYKRFQDKTAEQIRRANEIIAEYAGEGLDLTLRQLYYQFVARGLLDNKQSEYKKLGDTISKARLAGLVDWNAIEDRTRNMRVFPSFNNPAEMLEQCVRDYAEDPWEEQEYYVEAWIEKDALLGVLEVACSYHSIPHFSCRGYVSQSEMWRAAQRLIRKRNEGKKVVIFHLGDHDPSGMDMSRDIFDRLDLFMSGHGYTPPQVNRLGLNMTQIRKLQPPPNPAKMTDSRASDYIAEYGNQSWELDALDPKYIRDLVRREADKIIDQDIWDQSKSNEATSIEKLKRLVKQAKKG